MLSLWSWIKGVMTTAVPSDRVFNKVHDDDAILPIITS